MGATRLRTPLRFVGEARALVRGEREVAELGKGAYARAPAGGLPDPLPERVGLLLRRGGPGARGADAACVYDLATLEPVMPVRHASDLYASTGGKGPSALQDERRAELSELGAAALKGRWRAMRERLEREGDEALAGMLGWRGAPGETAPWEIACHYLKCGATSYDRGALKPWGASCADQLLALYAPDALMRGADAECGRQAVAFDVLRERSWRRAEAACAGHVRASLRGLRRLVVALEGVSAKTVRVVFSEEDPKGLAIDKERLASFVVSECKVPRLGRHFAPSLCHDARGEAVAVRYRGKDVWAA